MKPKKHPLFSIYQWIVAYPLIALATILVATATVILSPVFPNNKLSYNPARWWGRFICRLCFVPVKVHGLDKLDPQQSYIFALNHQSFFDVFVNLIPVFTAILSWIILGEILTQSKWMGILIVVIGLFVSQWGKIKFNKEVAEIL